MGSIMGIFNKIKDIKDVKLSKKEEIALKAAFDDSHLRKGYKAPTTKKGNIVSRAFINYDNPEERVATKQKRASEWFEEHKRKTREGKTKFGIDSDVYDNITTQKDMFGKKKRGEGKVYKSGELIDIVKKQDWETGRTKEEQAEKRYVDQGFRTDKEHKEDLKRIEKGKNTGNTDLLTPAGAIVAAPIVATGAVVKGAADIAKKASEKGHMWDEDYADAVDTSMPLSARNTFIPRISMPNIQLPSMNFSQPVQSSQNQTEMPNLQKLGQLLGVL